MDPRMATVRESADLPVAHRVYPTPLPPTRRRPIHPTQSLFFIHAEPDMQFTLNAERSTLNGLSASQSA